MSDDIKAKLDSLKTLRGEMKDWKKDDLRKKKGIKDPEEVEVKDEKKEQGDVGGSQMQLEGEPPDEDDSVLRRLIAKLVSKE